jgi:hypothetical protein
MNNSTRDDLHNFLDGESMSSINFPANLANGGKSTEHLSTILVLDAEDFSQLAGHDPQQGTSIVELRLKNTRFVTLGPVWYTPLRDKVVPQAPYIFTDVQDELVLFLTWGQ